MFTHRFPFLSPQTLQPQWPSPACPKWRRVRPSRSPAKRAIRTLLLRSPGSWQVCFLLSCFAGFFFFLSFFLIMQQIRVIFVFCFFVFYLSVSFAQQTRVVVVFLISSSYSHSRYKDCSSSSPKRRCRVRVINNWCFHSREPFLPTGIAAGKTWFMRTTGRCEAAVRIRAWKIRIVHKPLPPKHRVSLTWTISGQSVLFVQRMADSWRGAN